MYMIRPSVCTCVCVRVYMCVCVCVCVHSMLQDIASQKGLNVFICHYFSKGEGTEITKVMYSFKNIQVHVYSHLTL